MKFKFDPNLGFPHKVLSFSLKLLGAKAFQRAPEIRFIFHSAFKFQVETSS